MYDAISKSNFQQEIFECYHDLIAFGTACLMIEEDQDDVLLFSARHIKEFIFKKIKKDLSIHYTEDLKCHPRQLLINLV